MAWIKKMGGHLYRNRSNHTSKKAAQKRAGYWRSLGYMARVHPNTQGPKRLKWSVFVGPKKNPCGKKRRR